MKRKRMEPTHPLPEMFRPLLWGYRFEQVDTVQHRDLIVQQALNYGRLAHWCWIYKQYGQTGIREAMERTPIMAVRIGVRRLITLLFGIAEDHFRHVSGGTH